MQRCRSQTRRAKLVSCPLIPGHQPRRALAQSSLADCMSRNFFIVQKPHRGLMPFSHTYKYIYTYISLSVSRIMPRHVMIITEGSSALWILRKHWQPNRLWQELQTSHDQEDASMGACHPISSLLPGMASGVGPGLPGEPLPSVLSRQDSPDRRRSTNRGQMLRAVIQTFFF